MMDTNQLEIPKELLHQWCREFPYPPTPDIAGEIVHRLQRTARPGSFLRLRLAWVVIALALLLAATMAVPSVRAQVLEFLQIGSIRILTEPTPEETPLGSLSVTATPLRTFPSIADLAGETSLEEARSKLSFPIRLPTYPPGLGLPDRVFLQDFEGQAVLLVWMDHEQPEQIRMNLLILGPGTFAQKGLPAIIEETSVNGQKAIWTEGAHFLQLGGNLYQAVPLVVEGNILIWEQNGITYRLETDLTLEETVRIAESLE